MMLTTAALSGVNVGLHACGTFGSMLAMSFEKFLADEDLCGAMKKLIKPVELTQEAFAMDLIKQLGTSGNYLMEDHTLERCRDEFFIPDLSIQTIHSKWLEMHPKEVNSRAGRLLERRLARYEKPEMDPEVEKGLLSYINRKKGA
jgi:trimethylamine--corrinoid protein Co-methyltransferase